MAKIVHVSESLATGVLSILATLVQAQVRDGHEVILIGSQVRGDTLAGWRQQLPAGLAFLDLPMQREIRPGADLGGALYLFILFRLLNPDVIHLHSSKAGALGRVAAVRSRARIVYQPHGLSFLRSDVTESRRTMFALIERCLSYLGGTVVACSEGEREALRGVASAERLALVPNGVDLSSISNLVTPASTQRRVGTCGRISAQKRPEFFAKVASELRGEAEFVWIGDGDPELKAKLLDAGVRVTGWCSRSEAMREVSQLAIYAQTSGWEGLPVAVIEALALGIPVVATNVVGNADLLSGTNAGYLVDAPDEMIAKLRLLLSDASARSQLGQEGRRIAHERYSSTSMIRAFYSTYGLECATAVEFNPADETALAG